MTGMVGSLEYSLGVDKLDENGDLWKAEEEDITLQRSGLPQKADSSLKGPNDLVAISVSQAMPWSRHTCLASGDICRRGGHLVYAVCLQPCQ